MRSGVLLGQIKLPTNLRPLITRILDDWRGLYTYCKTRRLSIHVLEEEHQRLRALADSFYAAFRQNPQVEFNEAEYRVKSSVIIHGSESKILFPFDLFIHESHADILPDITEWLRIYTSQMHDERVFIDRLAREFKRVSIILKKNDIRIIKLFTNPDFISDVGNLFPSEFQIARRLGVTEATAEMRIRRLMDVQAIQLFYQPHPVSFKCTVQLLEHSWPLESKFRESTLYSFEYSPGRGVSAIIIPMGKEIQIKDSFSVLVEKIRYSWNFTQLDQWNKDSWEKRTKLTTIEEEPLDLPKILLDLNLERKNHLNSKDAKAVDALQQSQGIDTDLFEKTYNISSEEAKKRLNKLIEGNHCVTIPHFLHIGLENRYFVYLKAENETLDNFYNNLSNFPQSEVLMAEDQLLGVVGLPKQWVYDFAIDAEELKSSGNILYYRVASFDTIYSPRKSAKFLLKVSSS